jgi:hypothetical protein
MNRKIIRLYKNDFNKIDDFLSNNFSSPTHWQDWNNIVSKYYNTEFFYFALINDNKITGICPVHKTKNKYNYRLISGPKGFNIPFGGWIFSENVNFDFTNLKLNYNESLEIFSLPLIKEFNATYNECKLLKLYQTAIINLEKTEEEILNSFSTGKKYKIRKAEKNEVEILEIDEIGIDNYYKFYVETNKQYGLENLPKSFFLELINNVKNIKIDFLVAKKDSEILGQLILVSDKNYSIIWLGSRLEKGPNFGYFDLLHWEMIKKAKSYGCKYYDACYLEKDRLPNIYKFKIGYTDNIYPVVNIIKKSAFYRVINRVQKIID